MVMEERSILVSYPLLYNPPFVKGNPGPNKVYWHLTIQPFLDCLQPEHLTWNSARPKPGIADVNGEEDKSSPNFWGPVARERPCARGRGPIEGEPAST
jgi:hypothetical protein